MLRGLLDEVHTDNQAVAALLASLAEGNPLDDHSIIPQAKTLIVPASFRSSCSAQTRMSDARSTNG